ncbi:MAG: GntR family transcriptional regulator [Oscillospiraceae bacterium]|nr:GntR family transcriptional regulator [Oscillospiraceae bacterium]
MESWGFDFDDRTPIFRQIVLRFRRAFVRGESPPGGRIPSIREMSALLKVNTNTCQRAYQEMERDGLIYSKRGTGYFFTEDDTMLNQTRRELALESLRRFVEEMRALGCGDEDIVTELTAYMKGDEQHDADS